MAAVTRAEASQRVQESIVAATVAIPRRIAQAAACDLLEQPQRHFEVSDGICAVTLRPFQLMTLRLTPDHRP